MDIFVGERTTKPSANRFSKCAVKITLCWAMLSRLHACFFFFSFFSLKTYYYLYAFVFPPMFFSLWFSIHFRWFVDTSYFHWLLGSKKNCMVLSSLIIPHRFCLLIFSSILLIKCLRVSSFTSKFYYTLLIKNFYLKFIKWAKKLIR